MSEGLVAADAFAAPCWTLSNAVVICFAWRLGRVAFADGGWPVRALAGARALYGWRSAWRGGLILGGLAICFGGYWYVRNFCVTGAPLFPLGAREGVGYPHFWRTAFAGNSRPELYELAVIALWRMTGPCHLGAVFAAPLATLGLLGAGVNRLKRGERVDAVAALSLGALVVGTAAVYVCTPFAVEDQPGTLNQLRWAYTPARYGLCFLSTSVLAFIWLLQRGSEQAASFCAARPAARFDARRAIRVGAQALFAAALVWQFSLRLAHLRRHPEFIENPDPVGAVFLGANLLAAGWLVLEVLRRGSRYRPALVGLAAVALLAGVSVGAARLSKRWHPGYAAHFDILRGTRVFSHLANKPPLTIAALDHRYYPIFGSARQHRVCAPHTLKTYDGLTRYLAPRMPDVVASPRRNTGQAFDRYKPGPRWMTSDAARFPPLETSGSFALFRYRSSPTSGVRVGNCHGDPRRRPWPVKLRMNDE